MDETGDAKSSTDCVGVGRQYSGAIGGVGLCQVAVHLAVVTATMKVIIDRALYLPADWAADEERRGVTGVPEEIGLATKPQQALTMVADALAAGIEARWFAGDEVYCGRELRWGIRVLGLGYTDGVPLCGVADQGWGVRGLAPGAHTCEGLVLPAHEAATVQLSVVNGQFNAGGARWPCPSLT